MVSRPVAIATLERIADLKRARAALTSHVQAALNPDARVAAEARLRDVDSALERLASSELPARESLWDADIAAGDPQYGGLLNTQFPAVLLPMRLETAFDQVAGQPEVILHIRFIPDAIAVDAHDPLISPAESAASSNLRDAIAVGKGRQAWATMAKALGVARATYVLAKTRPELVGGARAGERLAGWSRAAIVRALPDTIWVRVDQDPPVAATPIVEPLWFGLDAAEVTIKPDSIDTIDSFKSQLSASLKWTVDFTEAKRVGLGVSLRLSRARADHGVNVTAVGIRSSSDHAQTAAALEALLAAHSASDGLAILPIATPTNNTERPSGFTSEVTSALPETPATPAAGSDGPRLARALGISSASLAVEGAAGRDDSEAFHMARALWPATWGAYFNLVLRRAALPAVARAVRQSAIAAHGSFAEAVAAIREHFLTYVRARGPYATLRVGRNPYGVLPCADLESWTPRAGDPLEQWLPNALGRLRNHWQSAVSRVPRLTPGAAQPDEQLFDVLALQATSCSSQATLALGAPVLELGGELQDGDIASIRQALGGGVAPRPAVPLGDRSAEDRLLDRRSPGGWYWLFDGLPFISPEMIFVAEKPDRQALARIIAHAGRRKNCLSWLLDASLDELWNEVGVPTVVKQTLLYQLGRHAILRAIIEASAAAPGSNPTTDEPDVVVRGHAELASSRERLARTVTVTEAGRQLAMSIGEYVVKWGQATSAGVDAPQLAGAAIWPAQRALGEVRASLAALAQLSTEKLHLLLAETLDLCSYRLDAWITSFATRRLDQMRRQSPATSGAYVGMWGCVEQLRMRGNPSAAEPFVLAPSIDHAKTAAVLLAAHAAHTNADGSRPFNISLPSGRVRNALRSFDALGKGNPLGAILGQALQRELETRSGGELGRYLPALRELYPLDGPPAEGGAAADSVMPHVPNGVDLLNSWHSDPAAFLSRVGVGAGHAAAFRAAVRRLSGSRDAMADLALAEQVHQIVRGNPERAAGAARMMSGDSAPHAEFEVARSPRSAVQVTHRLVVSLPVAAPRVDPLAAWTRTPRSTCVGDALERWLAAMLGPPEKLGFSARVGAGAANFTVKQLELSPIDLVLLDLDGAELTREIRRLVGTGTIQLDSAASGVVPLWRTRALLAALRIVINGAAAARPAQLRQSDRNPDEVVPGPAAGQCAQRIVAAAFALQLAAAALSSSLDAGVEAQIETSLNDLGRFGIAIPTDGTLAQRAAAALRVAAHRLTNLTMPEGDGDLAAWRDARFVPEVVSLTSTDPEQGGERALERCREVATLIFGRPLPLVTTVDIAPELRTALQAGVAAVPVKKLDQRLHQSARLHPLVRDLELARVVAAARGVPPPMLAPSVAQLPFVPGDGWALADAPPERLRPGLTSYVFVGPMPAAGIAFAGLVVAEWTEAVPFPQVDLGVAMRFDRPDAEAPHAILLAVPEVMPTGEGRWTRDSLFKIVDEAMDSAKQRMVDPEALRGLGHYLPASFVTVNLRSDTPSFFFSDEVQQRVQRLVQKAGREQRPLWNLMFD
jgi:hypothetical protein